MLDSVDVDHAQSYASVADDFAENYEARLQLCDRECCRLCRDRCYSSAPSSTAFTAYQWQAFWMSVANRTCSTALSFALIAKLVVASISLVVGILVVVVHTVTAQAGPGKCASAGMWLLVAGIALLCSAGLHCCGACLNASLFYVEGMWDAIDLRTAKKATPRRLCAIASAISSTLAGLAVLFIQAWAIYGAVLFFQTPYGDESGGDDFSACASSHKIGFALSTAFLAVDAVACVTIVVLCIVGVAACCVCARKLWS